MHPPPPPCPKDTPVLIPGTGEYVTLDGKRDFAAATELRIVRWEITLLFRRAHCNDEFF